MKIVLENTDYNLDETENEIVSIEIEPNTEFSKIIETLISEINIFEPENQVSIFEIQRDFSVKITTQFADEIYAIIKFV